jgi:pimeloyl-ACP methyl ester carboxylesterase
LSSFAGGSLFGSRAGPQPADVLALHGWGRGHSDFDLALAELVGSRHNTGAVSLDLPGFGASPAPGEPCGAAGYAEMISPVFDECRSQVVLVGHSFGGRVAVELAVRFPDAVASLVLCGVPLLRRADRPAARPALRYRLARKLHRRGLLGDEAMERLRQRFGSADYRSATGVMRDVLVTVVNETYEAQLGEISQPVELVWGRDDDSAPVEVARRASGILADARLTVLDGVGHFVPTEAAPSLVDAISRRLDVL